MAANRSELGISQNPDQLLSPERQKYSIVLATDLEGPHIVGDTALNVMSRFVRPSNGDATIDYGGELYGQTYEWFEENFDTKGLGQEGSDIVLALPSLMVFGVTSRQLHEEALTSKRTPGSEKYLAEQRSQGALIFGVTTSWDEPHRPIVMEKLGFDGMKGTDLRVDEHRSELVNSGRFVREMETTQAFLNSCFSLIEQRAHAEGDAKSQITEALNQRLGRFFVDQLGVNWDETGKMTLLPHATQLAKIMASLDVVGDKRKEEISQGLFSQFGADRAVLIAVGDGFNDRRMLDAAPWSIGLNGDKAAQAAKIGVVTPDVSILSDITALIKRDPTPSPERYQQVVIEAQEMFKDNPNIDIHLGGLGVDADKVALHKAMKKEIRGKGSLLP